jgi:ADP-heptose:LPS heptosyltransferase
VSRPWLTAVTERALGFVTVGRSSDGGVALPQPPRRLLVVKVHGMGDSVLIRSILEQIRARNPDMYIGVLAGPGTVHLLTLDSDFRIHIYQQKELTLRSLITKLIEIRRCHYEAILNFEQASAAGTAFLAAAGIPVHLGFLGREKCSKERFLSHAVRFDDDRSMWKTFLELARLLDPGLSSDFGILSVRCSAESESDVRDWWDSRIDSCGKAVAFHIGSARGMDFRRWPVERFVQLAEQLRIKFRNLVVLLTGSEEEQPLITKFAAEYSGRCVDASTSSSIEWTIGVLRRCGLLVSNDTGIMHLGAAIGVPTVGLFGPNTPRHWAPIGRRATYVYDTTVSCSPCIDNYRNRLPLACTNIVKSRCMYDISVASVLAAIKQVTDDWML